MNNTTNVQFGYCSDRLKNAALDVLAKLPPADLDMIQRRNVLIHEGKVDGDFGSCEPETDSWSTFKCSITIDESILPTSAALRGAIVHELAHACLGHHHDVKRWRERNLPYDRVVTSRALCESEADTLVVRWGFTAERLEVQKFQAGRLQALANKTV